MALNVSKKGGIAPKAPVSQTPSWAKRGKAASAAMEKYEEDAEKHYAEMNRMWRFFLKKDESAPVTFVDGNLLPDGTLDILTYREHTVQVNGDWKNFVCIAESEPCPLCEGGDFPSLVGVLTVIDHRVFKGKKGVYTNTPKLFVAKKNTIKLLQQLATKKDGLAGCRFEISRMGDNDPAVGGSFDWEGKGDPAKLAKEFTRKGKDGKTVSVYVPADYETEIGYKTGKELRAIGFGSGKPIGSETAPDAEHAGEDAGKHM